ncbi:MAG: SPOCS domain-containing protein [Romboutsia sp.]|uniref:SPOCS domain-containing protein n=1 Tax=Romboutsia sp. TaxID=1965302 RepID=UPI003F3E1E1D
MKSTSTSFSAELIDISGLCNPSDVTNVISQYPYWAQMNIPEKLTVPDQKPDIEQINSLNISVDIFRSEVIKVPVSQKDKNGNYEPNLEGKISTGRKLIIEGQLCQKIDYTANEPQQSIHSAHFYVPFSSYIIVPDKILFSNSKVPVDSLDIDFQVNACIEDVAIKLIDLRCFLKQVTLLLYAVPNQSI